MKTRPAPPAESGGDEGLRSRTFSRLQPARGLWRTRAERACDALRLLLVGLRYPAPQVSRRLLSLETDLLDPVFEFESRI